MIKENQRTLNVVNVLLDAVILLAAMPVGRADDAHGLLSSFRWTCERSREPMP